MSNKLSELNANSEVQASDLMYLVQENDDNELEGRKILAKNAIGYVIPYATWQTMTPQEQAAAGKVYVPDFPTATPNATEIHMSSSESTSVAEAIDSLVDFMTLKTADGTLDSTYTSSGNIYCFKKGGTLVIKLKSVLLTTLTSRTTIGRVPSGFIPPIQATGFIDASTILWGVETNGSVWIDSGASGKRVWGTLTNIVGG
jgi:hypothetical protein